MTNEAGSDHRRRVFGYVAGGFSLALLMLTGIPGLLASASASDRIVHQRCVEVDEFPQPQCELAVSSVTPGGSTVVIPGTRGRYAGLPEWLPSGDRISFNTDDGIEVAPADGSAPGTVIIEEGRDFWHDWSPDGSRILFQSVESGAPGESGTYVLKTADPSGGDQETIIRFNEEFPDDRVPASASGAAWSPSGDQIIFLAMRILQDSSTEVRYWSIRPDGSNLQPLTESDLDFFGVFPTFEFSPDGDRVAFTRAERYLDSNGFTQVRYAVWTMNADGTNQEKIPLPTAGPTSSYIFGDWSPDGEELVVVGYESTSVAADGRLFRVPAEGGATQRITTDTPDLRREVLPSWSPLSSAVAITSGPTGLTNSTNASFGFLQLEDETEGTFECSLDGGAFETCVSPRSYAGLSDGEHFFRVRFVPDEGAAGPAVRRDWTVDATPPQVILEDGPSGDVESGEAEIRFRSNEPTGASFQCRLDSGPFFDCASPHQVSGLEPGLHGFEIVAFDAAGNASNPEFIEWNVVEPVVEPPIELDCPAGTQASLSFGVIVALAKSAEGCFRPVTVEGQPVFEATGLIMVNGIGLEPAGSGERILISQSFAQGRVWAEERVFYHFGDVRTQPMPLSFNGLTTTAAINKIFSLNENFQLSEFEKLLGKKGGLGIGVGFEFSPQSGGQTKITFKGTLPREVLQSLPDGTGDEKLDKSISVEVPVIYSNSAPVGIGVKVSLGEGWLGGSVKLKNLSLALDTKEKSFEIAGGIVMNQSKGVKKLSGKVSGLDADATLDFQLVLKPGPDAVFGIIDRLSVTPSNLEKHLGGGIFLQRAGLEIGTESIGQAVYAKLGGLGTVSFGPKIVVEPLFNGFMAAGDMGISVLWAHNEAAKAADNNVRFVAEGSGRILEVPVSNMKYTQFFPDKYTLEGGLNLSIQGWAGIGANITEALFDVDVDPGSVKLVVSGKGELELLGAKLELDAILGPKGYAACFGPPGGKVGFRSPLLSTSPPAVFSDSCDIAAIAPTVQKAAVVSAVDGTVDVRKGTITQTMLVKGDGAAPEVEVGGPGGRVLAAPPGTERFRSDLGVIVKDEFRDSTFVALFRPAAGRWTVSGRDGGPAVTGMSTAVNLPPVKVSGKVKSVKSGKGKKRRKDQGRKSFSWRSGPIPGQTLQIVEVAGDEMNTIATTRKRRGKVTFRPMLSTLGKRSIRVMVLRKGLPRASRTVSRFTVRPAKPPKKATRIRLRGRFLEWSLKGASATSVAVTMPDGTTLTRTVRKPRLKLPVRPRRGQKLRVLIVGIDAFNRPGRTAVQTIKANAKKKKRPPKRGRR